MSEETKKDTLREMCIAQGYVPAKCLLPGEIVFLLVKKCADPCKGCHIDRKLCGGRYAHG